MTSGRTKEKHGSFQMAASPNSPSPIRRSMFLRSLVTSSAVLASNDKTWNTHRYDKMTFEEVSDSDGSISILNSTDRNQESAAECGV